ncbi:MAG TPA: succinyl-CoA--3-ketoacid-CoA transferase [Elusimicrobia bacterium]|nr:succinyl-CoA--3-ketoacid-CoA transferase [Elusimicrobiota bacterium]
MRKGLSKEQIAARAAKEVQDGMYVNVGYGIPNLVPEYLKGRDIFLHTENGIIGMGPLAPKGQEDADLVNAAKQPVSVVPGGAIVSQSDSFMIIRGGHVAMTFLGAYQVSEKGDLANWKVPGEDAIPGIGGAMDLAAGTKRIVVTMTHTNKDGTPKIVKECTFPLTGQRCVTLIVTDLAVVRVTPKGLVLEEVAPGVTPEEVQGATGATLCVSPTLKTIEV